MQKIKCEKKKKSETKLSAKSSIGISRISLEEMLTATFEGHLPGSQQF
jgi:hypothetical protein